MMANKPGFTSLDPFAIKYPARSRSPLGQWDAAHPNCLAELGDTRGPTGCNDGAAILAHSWYRHTQGQTRKKDRVVDRKDTNLPRRTRTAPVTGIPNQLPASIATCPHLIVLPRDFVNALHALYSHSEKNLWNPKTQNFSPDGEQVEWAQRVTLYKASEIKLAGTYETLYSPEFSRVPESQIMRKVENLWEPDIDYKTIGVAHTHPKTNTFSGGDIAAISNDIAEGKDYRLSAVIRKDSIHLLLRTAKTFKGVRNQEKWQDKAKAKVDAKVQAEGKKPGEKPWKHHSYKFLFDQAIAELATENNCALYVYEKDYFRKIN